MNIALFVGLFLLALRVWWTRRDRSSRWFLLTFGTLGAVTVAGLFLPDVPVTDAEKFASRILLAVLLLFPYCLYRFTISFDPARRAFDAAASTLTLAIVASTFLVPDFPAEGEPRPSWFVAYLVGILAFWTILSVAAAWKLWRAGRGEPNLARQRMRMLSLGSLGLNLALIIAGSAPEDGSALITIVSQVFALASALFFYVGFVPPALLRLAWRRHETEELQRAIVALMTASEEQEVADALLPHVAAIFGGRSAAMLDASGNTIGAHGLTDGIAEDVGHLEPGAGSHVVAPGYVRVEMPFGSLLVWATPFTPFFGSDDVELLQSLGVLADLALERCRYLERDRQVREELERMNEELAAAQAVARLGSWEWDIKQNTLSWSKQLFDIFGVDPDGFTADRDSYNDLVHPDDTDEVNMMVDKAIRTGEFVEFEHRVIRPDGTIRWIRSRAGAEFDENGEPARMTGTAQDVTERKMAEEYEQELREADVRQKQALELNDNIVQGLAVAGMALEIGELTKAKEAIARTMAAAQSIITGLLRGTGRNDQIQPGDLIRSAAAGSESQQPPP